MGYWKREKNVCDEITTGGSRFLFGMISDECHGIIAENGSIKQP